VPAVIALVGGRAGSTRAGALGLTGLAVFAGASLGPLAAELPLGFAGLMLALSPRCSSPGGHSSRSVADERPKPGLSDLSASQCTHLPHLIAARLRFATTNRAREARPTDFLDTALGYAANGYPLFPLGPSLEAPAHTSSPECRQRL